MRTPAAVLSRILLSLALPCALIACSPAAPPAQVPAAPVSLATSQGFSPDTVKFLDPNIRSILPGNQGDLWFATNGQGLYHYQDSVLTRYASAQGLSHLSLWKIGQDKLGLWLTGAGKATRYDAAGFRSVPAPAADPAFAFQHATLMLDGMFTDGAHAYTIQLPETSPLHSTNRINGAYTAYCSLRDSRGHLWWGTQNMGVCRYDGHSLTWFATPELGVPVRTLYEDSQGNIWIGNNGYGLFRWDGKTLTHLTREHGLENPGMPDHMADAPGTLARVWSITGDGAGGLWIGTIDAGLWHYDGQRFRNYTEQDGLGSDSIWILHRDAAGLLWICSDGGGVTVWDGKAFRPFLHGQP